jgi:hypothetical protein
MADNNLVFVKYEATYKEGLLELLKHMWQYLNYLERKEKFEWRYEQNPYTTNPHIYLAIDGDQIAGFRAFVVQKFKLEERVITIFSPADAIVHPDYRRRGIFSRLNEIFIQDVSSTNESTSFILNLTSNQYSTPGCIKQGWKMTDGSKSFYYRISPLSFIMQKKKKQEKIEPLNNSYSLSHGINVEFTSTIRIQETVAFNNNYSNKKVFTNLRDEAFYNWRYYFKVKEYQYVYCYKDDALVGYLIINRMKWNHYSLIEYGAVDKTFFRLMIKLAMRKLKTPFIRAWAFERNDKLLLKSSLFIHEHPKILKFIGKERLPVLVRPCTEKAAEVDFLIDGLDLRSIDNWQIQLTDRH